MTPVRIVELSHPISPDMPIYQGMPPPELTTHTSREQSAARLGTGVSFYIGQLSLPANTGTYVDAPFHYHPELADMAILEHLTGLDALPATGARLTALPAPVRGLGSFPVRAVAVLP